MYYLIATLHTLGVQLQDKTNKTVLARRRDDGSVSIEHVVWAVAIIAIVGIAVAAVTAYVKKISGQIG